MVPGRASALHYVGMHAMTAEATPQHYGEAAHLRYCGTMRLAPPAAQHCKAAQTAADAPPFPRTSASVQHAWGLRSSVALVTVGFTHARGSSAACGVVSSCCGPHACRSCMQPWTRQHHQSERANPVCLTVHAMAARRLRQQAGIVRARERHIRRDGILTTMQVVSRNP